MTVFYVQKRNVRNKYFSRQKDVFRKSARRKFVFGENITIIVTPHKQEFYCLSFFFILTLPVTFSTISLKTFVQGMTDLLNEKSS